MSQDCRHRPYLPSDPDDLARLRRCHPAAPREVQQDGKRWGPVPACFRRTVAQPDPFMHRADSQSAVIRLGNVCDRAIDLLPASCQRERDMRTRAGSRMQLPQFHRAHPRRQFPHRTSPFIESHGRHGRLMLGIGWGRVYLGGVIAGLCELTRRDCPHRRHRMTCRASRVPRSLIPLPANA